MTQLLHISYDLRRRNDSPVTTAVANLIGETRQISNVQVIDLLRITNLKKESVVVKDPGYMMVNSFGLPFGVFMIPSLRRAYYKILDVKSRNDLRIDSNTIIHAHKVTFEGYIAYLLSLKFKTKLILTLRQTDTWVFQRRPDLIKHFKPVFERSDKIVYLIPNIVKLMRHRVGDSFFELHIKNKLEFIPNIVERKINKIDANDGSGSFMTALRMDRRSVKRKNLKRLLSAISIIKSPDLKLQIIGDGEYMFRVKEWVRRFKIEENILFVGNIPNSEMDKYYGSSKAFLLPSLSESFGMVYAEALLNGTPIMYSKNRLGFDGIFEGVGIGVDPLSTESIANGINDLLNNDRKYRNRIKELNNSNEFEIFSSNYIKKKYSQMLTGILK